MLATSPQVIYVMRHGRTALDAAHRTDSNLDLPLSDEGRRDVVEVLSDALKNVPIRCIYASNLKRTEETAHILKSGMPSNPEIEIRPDSDTWKLGSLAGEIKTNIRPFVLSLVANPDQKAPDGESYNEFTDRFDGFMDEMEEEMESGDEPGPILIICSGSNCRRISERLFKDRDVLDIDESGLFMMYPAGDGNWSAVLIHGGAENHGEAS
jgi:broad specificity phosphatase PhoE